MNEHDLKTDTPVFEAVLDGRKTFELRSNDRGYQVGDRLRLRETKHTGEAMRAGAPLEYTGREVIKTVSHVLEGYGLMPGWVCLSFAAASQLEAARTEARADARAAWMEEAARAVEQHDRTGREWVPGSLWGTLTREAAARIRALAPQPNMEQQRDRI